MIDKEKYVCYNQGNAIKTSEEKANMYQYEMHCHTSPVSACAKADVRDTVTSYKNKGYDGIFITNHFLNTYAGLPADASYEEKLSYYFSDFEEAVIIGKEVGIKVFFGIETTYRGTDFLVYGLDKAWFLQHPQIMEMDIKEKLALMREHGAFVAQAHPYRDSWYIDHIRLYPNSVDAIEVINANRTPLENKMARLYAENYGLLMIAGSDNHLGSRQEKFAGLQSEVPIESVEDMIEGIKNGKLQIFEAGLNVE